MPPQGRREVSVFDVIGPIMVGPSSSHTAGAVRLGLVARAILGAQPNEALIELHGSFAETGRGHGTDLAIIAGLLGMSTDDERIRDSFEIAAERGLTFRFEEVDLGEDAHPNSAKITIATEDSTPLTVIGASIGGGLIEVREIEGFDVHFSGAYDTLLVLADDRPGTINAITGWLLGHGINVAFLRVGRKKRGGEAMMVVETDQPIPDQLLDPVRELANLRWARLVPKVSN